MKLVWKPQAEKALQEKAIYIAKTSQNIEIAKNFFNDVVEMTSKLKWIAEFLILEEREVKDHVLKNGHKVKYFVHKNTVYITDFIPKGMNK